MAFNKEKRVLAAAAEVTPGLAVTPGASSADFQARGDVDWTPNMEFEGDKVATGDHGENESISGVASVDFKAKVSLKGAAAVNTIPDWSAVLEACGLKRTAHGTTGQSWAMHTDNEIKTLTMWGLHTEAGAAPQQLAVQAFGVMGAPKLVCEGRVKPVKWDLAFKGVWSADADIASGSKILINAPYAGLPVKFASNTVTIQGTLYRADSFEMDWQVELAEMPDNNSNGIRHFWIKKWAPRLKVAVELPRAATHNWRTKLRNMDVGAVVITMGDNWTLTVPRGQAIARAHKEVAGVEYMDLTFACLRNGSADATMDAQVQAELLYGSKT